MRQRSKVKAMTHYWYRAPNLDATKFKAFSEDCRKVLNASRVSLVCLVNGNKRNDFQITDNVVNFNGAGKWGHETFYFEKEILAAFSEAGMDEDRSKCLGFCKTANKPYDICVVACLVLAKIHFGYDVKVRSDDSIDWWRNGADLVRKTLDINFNLYQEETRGNHDDFKVDVEEKVIPKAPSKDPEIVKKEQDDFKKSDLYELIG